MKVECKLKNLKRTIGAGKNVNSVSIYGEVGEGEERLCSVNLTLNNVSDAGLKEIEKDLGIEDMEVAVIGEFPVAVELKVLQKTLGAVS